VFGLFGTFTSSATVQALNTALVHGATPTGSVYVQNTGTSNTNVNSMSVTYGGATCSPVINTGNPVLVTAGAGSTAVTISGAGTCTGASVSGEAYSGLLYLSNGGQVAFTGTFS
jgi:hypothetical protein